MVSRVLQCLLFRATVCSLLSCTRSYGRVAVHMCVVPLHAATKHNRAHISCLCRPTQCHEPSSHFCASDLYL